MIAKIWSGRNFRTVLNHLMSPERAGRPCVAANAHLRDLADEYEPGHRHRIIGGDMGGSTADELAREFMSLTRLRPDIVRRLHHASLSIGSGDRLTVEQWFRISERYVEGMGFDGTSYTVIQHRDTEHDHIHIVVSRINIKGALWNDWKSYARAEALMREFEEAYDLERVLGSRETRRLRG